jgi:hypothetical protein
MAATDLIRGRGDWTALKNTDQIYLKPDLVDLNIHEETTIYNQVTHVYARYYSVT